MSDTWLVVVNWNNAEDTLGLLSSLQAADLQGTAVLLVDNGSSDGSVERVEALHPWVTTLQTGRNLGFAGGSNRGITFALDKGASVVGVLNNDTTVEPDFWPPLVSLALSGPVAVSPDIRYQTDPAKSWFYGGTARPYEGFPRHLQEPEQPSRGAPQESELVTGCCFVASRETWKAVGLFDERYFLIFEDSDWSMRARSRGTRLMLEPSSRIYHGVSRSFRGSALATSRYYYSRNGLLFARRWLGTRGAVAFAVKTGREALTDLRHAGPQGLRYATLRLMGLGAVTARAYGPAGGLVTLLAGRDAVTRR
ncbi:MAG: glycosyltransferase family 2 protein [Acidimicrobiales bacterium]